MRFLLDTCTFLWIAARSDELSPHARECFADPDNEVYLSVVSAWEIALKHALKRLPLPEPPARFVPVERDRHGSTRCRSTKSQPCIWIACPPCTGTHSIGCSSARPSCTAWPS